MKFNVSTGLRNLKGNLIQYLLPLEPIFYLTPLYILFYFSVWQGIETAKWKRMIHQKSGEKDELVRKNDELKIGIVSYTSAERIEALYRKTYQYLPISIGNRIITVELPAQVSIIKKDSL